ncbi:aminoglycoside phosphotransferase family protein [bacterium]|nr:aminoglycoside phosphotransferase family protein [bacterium]
MPDLSIQSFLPQAAKYLRNAQLTGIPGWTPDADFEIAPLAQGEYNMNFLVRQNGLRWVLRINTKSQIGLSNREQIGYEYRTLSLLEPSGVAPQSYFLDDSFTHLPYGILGMQYFPGERLDYHHDLAAAARLMARYHQLSVPMDQVHLIREEQPLSLTYERCHRMLQVYFNSDLADPELAPYLQEVIDWADGARQRETYFLRDPWPCIINTEVNNSNWILDREANTIHLVDWEKPLWGDPSQDLSHFRVPTTTLWKTNVRLTAEQQKSMMAAYKDALEDDHLRDTIEERTRLRDPFNCLRGVSWCAMAWVQYQQGDHLLKNPDTFQKFAMYVDPVFVRSLFDLYLKVN